MCDTTTNKIYMNQPDPGWLKKEQKGRSEYTINQKKINFQNNTVVRSLRP